MNVAVALDPAAGQAIARPIAAGRKRFERVAITCVFGDPRDKRSWSGAPANLAAAMERLGVTVEAIHPRLGTAGKLAVAGWEVATGHGRPLSGEQILRSAAARHWHARQVAAEAQRLGVHEVLHTGSLDLPAIDLVRGVRHYLYCDHTWELSRRHHPMAERYTAAALAAYERSERRALATLTHIFTFGSYVRDNLIGHYGVDPSRVTAVGSGMGAIEPFDGAKDFARPHLLFVAKHLFEAKGGPLLLAAFEQALAQRPDLKLTVVGDERSRRLVPAHPAIAFRAHLPWVELQTLFRQSTLLVQPMLNDPWGQVYLEALVSRTPVIGLRRHGLPEITGEGRFGFLVDRAEPGALAATILEALSDPARLEAMALAGQGHVLASYSWDRTAEKIVFA